MRSPLFSIILWLYFKFICNSLTLKLPIVLINCRMNNLFILINCCYSYMLFIINIIFFYHICLINLFVLLSFSSLFIRLGLISKLYDKYWLKGSSYLGFLKAMFLRFNPFVANWVSISNTWSPEPDFNFNGGKSHAIFSFLH